MHETVTLGDPVLATLAPADVRVIERHLRAHPRWEVSEQKGVRYAFRREKPETTYEPAEGVAPGDPEIDIPGGYSGALNGFHSSFDSKDVVQTRVLLSLGREYGFGSSRNVTRAKADAGTAKVAVGKYMDQPGLESYLIVEGAEGVTLEVFEQSHLRARTFTIAALREVTAEIRDVLAARDEIEKDGFAAALMADTPLKRGKPRMRIDDGMQPGIYAITAWINPGSDGRVYARVFFEGADPAVGPQGVPHQEIRAIGQELSGDRVRPGTKRYVGWGSDPSVLFPYQAGLTVYEGGWSDAYRARFELWLDRPDGTQSKLLETSRTIAGWER